MYRSCYMWRYWFIYWHGYSILDRNIVSKVEITARTCILGCTDIPQVQYIRIGENLQVKEKEVREMTPEEQLTYIPKTEEEKIAKEVIEFLRHKKLPVWQVKTILSRASSLVEWEKLK